MIKLERPDASHLSREWARRQCRAGTMPAEVLSTADRERLVSQLWRLGWTDVEIATHTHMTTYTASRIRARIGLRAHPQRRAA